MLHGGTVLLAMGQVPVVPALAGAVFPTEALTEVALTETSISGTHHRTSAPLTSGHRRPTRSATAAVEVPRDGCPGQTGPDSEMATLAIGGPRRRGTSPGRRMSGRA
jgi:hypothetical protein